MNKIAIMIIIITIIVFIIIKIIIYLKKLLSNKLIVESFLKFYMKIEYYIENLFYKYPSESTVKKFKKEVKKAGFLFELSSQYKEIIKGNSTEARNIILKYYKISPLLNEKAYYISCLEPSTSHDLIPFFLEEMIKYNVKSDGGLETAINNFLLNTKNKDYTVVYLKFLQKKELGNKRWALVKIVGNLKIKSAIPIILNILNEGTDDLVLFCLESLYKLDSTKKYLKYYKKYENYKDSYVRKKINKLIEKIEKVK